jgi:NADH:ubiquinone oxidoreductase subunit 6 (subunit J)
MLLTAGFACAVAAPNEWGIALGLFALGLGQGTIYYSAIYYGLAVGAAEVDAGGIHEALVGAGYFMGPALGLAVFFLLAASVVWLFHWSGAVSTVKAGATPPELSTNPAEFVTAAKAFGRLLYSKYLLPLEIAGFLLLVALVGVVSLSKDNPENQA